MPATAGLFGMFDVASPSGRQKVDATEDQKELLYQLGLTAAEQRRIGTETYEGSAGLREAGIPQLENYLTTGQLPPALRNLTEGLYTTGREDLEQQFKRAGEEVRDVVPVQGGQLNDALVNLAQGRAGQVGRLRSDIQGRIEAPLRQSLFGTALTTAFGQPQVALSGLSGASSSYGAAAGGYGDIAQRSLGEQMEREQRHKEEVQEVGSMIAMAGMG